jgi:hypothetical protein
LTTAVRQDVIRSAGFLDSRFVEESIYRTDIRLEIWPSSNFKSDRRRVIQTLVTVALGRHDRRMQKVVIHVDHIKETLS